MQRNQKKVSASGVIVLVMVLLNAIILEQGLVANQNWYKLSFVALPLLLVSIVFFRRKLSA